MARKLPKLDHVKYVTRRGKVYAYFNTGKKHDGKVIYQALPSPSAVGFFDRYAALKAGLKADDATIRLGVHLLYFTGLRIGDVCAIRWGMIRKGVLTIIPEKTKRHKKVLYIPVHAELRDELARVKPAGLTIMHGSNELSLRLALQAFTRGLGVETVPHGLRKNAVNALLEMGCMVAEVAAITGQSYQIVEHYAAKVNTRKLGQAAMLKFETGRRDKSA